MGSLNDGASQQLRKRLQKIECDIVRTISNEPEWMTPNDAITLRWALSLARLSKIRTASSKADDLRLDHASDRYRAELFALLSGENAKIPRLMGTIERLVKKERLDLLSLFSPTLSPDTLDDAVRRRPLALTLSGGGGTGFVFIGAFYAMEESGLIPSVITGSSMGAILGAYRARTKHFSFAGLDDLVEKTSWTKIAQPYSGPSRFGVPAPFRLYLRDVVGHEFENQGQFMQLKDLAIPLRVCVGGLSTGAQLKDDELQAYAHLLEKPNSKSIISIIMDFAQKPVKPIYLGRDQLSKDFDVLDAIGFSAAIPGIFHYDILRNDPRMVSLVTNLFEREGVFRLIDGGFVDNLPAQEALRAVDDGDCDGYDAFSLSLDSFMPGLNRHILFYPLMRFAQENSREGHEASHCSIIFKNVLSPINLMPTKDIFHYAVKHGYQEFSTHIAFIRKMIGPIPDPSWLHQ